jgi:nitroimidazol reductase NimA-like FMN-containing flavoprotein (pyridoxamine 5'-phosphate oxidase superfamily)
MRRREFEMSREEAMATLATLPTMHLASTLPDGTPVFRTLHGVVDDGWIAFHSAPKGEKTSLIGRPAVICSEESVATVPSTFFDPVKACPATTYYRSVQVQGLVEEIEAPERKARILQRLLE